MATVTERLALIVSANGGQAIRELDKVGTTAKTQLGSAEASIDRVSTKMTSFGAASIAGGLVVASGLKVAADAAQGLADSYDKADAVFGSSTGLAKFADTSAEKLGLSKEAALDAASAYGSLLAQSGIGGNALASASAALATRTADLAEKFKKPYEEVQAAIEAVIKTGSNKSLKGLLGVDIQIDPADLKGLDTAAKTTKVYQEILRQTAGSADFFANSTDDMGVRFAVAQAKMRDAQAEFGEAAIPVLVKLADAGTTLIGVFDKLPAPVKETLGTLAVLGTVGAVAGGALSVVGGGLLKLVAPIRSVVEAAKAGGGGVSGLASSIGGKLNPAVIATGGAALVAGTAIASWVGDMEAAEDRIDRVKAAAAGLSEELAGTETADPYSDIGNKIAKDLRSAGATDVLTTLGLNAEQSGKLAVQAGDDWAAFVDKYGTAIERVDPSILQQATPDTFLGVGEGAAELEDKLNKLPESIRPVVAGLLEMYRAGDLNGDQFRAAIETFAQAGESAKITATDITKLGTAIKAGVPEAALTAKGSLEDLNTALNNNAPFDLRLAAAQRLAAAFPDVANKAGILRFAMQDVDAAAGATADKVDKLHDALKGLANIDAESLGAFAGALSSNISAVDGILSANDRLTAAQRRLADLTNRDTAAIGSAWERLAAAKQRLDDILAGDGNNLEQESPEAQLARARAALAEANTRLVANRNDAGALTARDTALADIERAIQRRQDLTRTAAERGRQIRDARQGIAAAEQDVAKATAPASQEDIDKANREISLAGLAVQAELAKVAEGISDGTLSFDAINGQLDLLVAQGIITPEAKDALTGRMKELETQAGLAAAALQQLAQLQLKSDQYANYGGGDRRTAATAGTVRSGPNANDLPYGAQGVESISEAQGRALGLDINRAMQVGALTDSTGKIWTYSRTQRRWYATPGRAAGGRVVSGQDYLVGENGPEIARFDKPGYIVNAANTRAMAGGSSQPVPSGDTVSITITEAISAKQTAREVVAERRRARFLGRL